MEPSSSLVAALCSMDSSRLSALHGAHAKITSEIIIGTLRVLLNLTNDQRVRDAISARTESLQLLAECAVSLPPRLSVLFSAAQVRSNEWLMSDLQGTGVSGLCLALGVLVQARCSSCLCLVWWQRRAPALRATFPRSQFVGANTVIATCVSGSTTCSCSTRKLIMTDHDEQGGDSQSQEEQGSEHQLPEYDLLVHSLGLLVNLLEMSPDNRAVMATLELPSSSDPQIQVCTPRSQ